MTEAAKDQLSYEFETVLSDESLAIFIRNLKEFDHLFSDMMTRKVDFNIKLDIHGDKGELNVARLSFDSFERPKKEQEKITSKASKKGIAR